MSIVLTIRCSSVLSHPFLEPSPNGGTACDSYVVNTPARVLREYRGNRSCSVVLRRANRSGASLGKLLNLKPILSGAASS
jgi:hypothetical protein